MGSSSGCLLKNDLIYMSDDYMKSRSHLKGDVWIYSQQATSAGYMAKHHGIIISIPE